MASKEVQVKLSYEGKKYLFDLPLVDKHAMFDSFQVSMKRNAHVTFLTHEFTFKDEEGDQVVLSNEVTLDIAVKTLLKKNGTILHVNCVKKVSKAEVSLDKILEYEAKERSPFPLTYSSVTEAKAPPKEGVPSSTIPDPCPEGRDAKASRVSNMKVSQKIKGRNLYRYEKACSYRTAPCSHGTQCTEDNCWFYHDIGQKEGYKKICTFQYLYGDCKYGDRCTYTHKWNSIFN